VSESIPLSMPDITDDEIHDVAETLRSGELTAGPQVDRFEWMIARRCARSRAVAVNAETSGILLSLIALGVKPGDEVIVPAYGSSAANSVELLGANPIFVDCDPRTLNLPADAIEQRVTDRTRAIVAADTFGNPVGMNQIAALSTKLEIPLIEDAGEGLGGHHAGDPVGRFGRVAVFSFGRNGIITTGEGGMIVTHEDRLADRCLALRDEGRPELSRDHEKGMEDRPLPEGRDSTAA
jgi:perosamine synthetase